MKIINVNKGVISTIGVIILILAIAGLAMYILITGTGFGHIIGSRLSTIIRLP